MVGEPQDKKLKTKAAETYGVLLFCLDELAAHPQVHPRSRAFLEAGRQLTGLIDLWHGSPWRLPPDAVDAGLQLFNRYLVLTNNLEDLRFPKRHLAMRLVKSVGFLGNPRWFANWMDESLNKLLRATCRNVSQSTFDVTVLSGMRRLSRSQTSPEAILKEFNRG